tara:strand:- start:830 stop:2548 length:1719 start_codon:yes stop_codon:yes gene_type:complete
MRVLGFSGSHDSSVCIVNDGEIEYFGKEERYSRTKRDKQPWKAFDAAIAAAKGPIDYAVLQNPSLQPVASDLFFAYLIKKLGLNKNQIYDMTKDAHHRSHAFFAFNNCPWDKALVFVVDRNGSQIFDPADEPVKFDQSAESYHTNWIGRETESVYIFKQPNGLEAIHKSFWMVNASNPRSYRNRTNGYSEFHVKMKEKYPKADLCFKSGYGITKVYESGTTLIGQDAMENGKTMGLSSYGEPKGFPPLFVGSTPIDHHFIHDAEFVNVAFETLPRHKHHYPNVTELNYKPLANWAYHIQRETEKALNHLVQRYVKKTGIKKVCLVGGYALNVVANNYLISNNPDVEFYFEPNADDTGVAIGAAMFAYRQQTRDPNKYPLKDTFYHYLEPQDPVEGEPSTPHEIAALLTQGNSIALYDGNPEAGPRALGHRSILYDPRSKDAKKNINKVKNREWYRPFAGIILEKYFDEYFETLGLESSPNMTINFKAKQKAIDNCPGVIHVDDTCRVQTVTEGFMYEVLLEFHAITGVPVLLNTSFNLAGQPLVHTKGDALNTLHSSDLDYVYFVQDNALIQ